MGGYYKTCVVRLKQTRLVALRPSQCSRRRLINRVAQLRRLPSIDGSLCRSTQEIVAYILKRRISGKAAMKIEVHADPESTARAAAGLIASDARAVVSERGRYVMAVSGGRTPWLMLRALASENIPWNRVQIAQVDERVAPAGHPDRNLTHLQETLMQRAPLSAEQIHAMPVESDDLEAAAAEYAMKLREIAGSPPVLDVVHLGLGPDGHTASLIPGDPILEVNNRDVGVTGTYQGRRRMTLTYPILNRSRRILWVVTGKDKAEMVDRILKGDRSIPAGRIRRENALVFADRAAAGDRTEVA